MFIPKFVVISFISITHVSSNHKYLKWRIIIYVSFSPFTAFPDQFKFTIPWGWHSGWSGIFRGQRSWVQVSPTPPTPPTLKSHQTTNTIRCEPIFMLRCSLPPPYALQFSIQERDLLCAHQRWFTLCVPEVFVRTAGSIVTKEKIHNLTLLYNSNISPTINLLRLNFKPTFCQPWTLILILLLQAATEPSLLNSSVSNGLTNKDILYFSLANLNRGLYVPRIENWEFIFLIWNSISTTYIFLGSM